MRKRNAWTALFCAVALCVGLYCFWGWNQSITEGFTVLTARSMDETDAAEICADADEEVLVSASSDVSADETLAAVCA